ncbi:hypothetical protein LshimejAT787_0309670 [Lyophyllum shimeji]|uniref:Uncharacterized protein n=1 Tax=Lyophyllum shimeji TaxID=47721 RepID=A0A9P3PIP4_LYOSH|nr:hypothetical protein LshimejAT787_0309670 [Lyophyllum shimeji]
MNCCLCSGQAAVEIGKQDEKFNQKTEVRREAAKAHPLTRSCLRYLMERRGSGRCVQWAIVTCCICVNVVSEFKFDWVFYAPRDAWAETTVDGRRMANSGSNLQLL